MSESKSKYQNLAINSLIFLISSFGSKILSIIFIRFYTSVLSPEEYGMTDLVFNTSSLLVYVVAIEISSAVLRFVMDDKAHQKEIFAFGVRVSLIGCLIFGVTLLAFAYVNVINWAWYYYLFLYCSVVVNVMYRLITSYFRGMDYIKQVAISGVIVTAATIGSNLLFLLVFKWGVVGYMLSNILGLVVASMYCFNIASQKEILSFSCICKSELRKKMLCYSTPLIFNGIAWWINSSIDRYFITAIDGVYSNGIYAAASKIPVIMITLQTIFSEAWSLSAIKEFDEEDKDGFFGNILGVYVAFSVILGGGLILFNEIIATILFATDYREASAYSTVLIVATIFNGISGFIGSIFSAINKTSFYAVSTVIAAIFNLVLNWILIPDFGVMGASIATLVSFAVVALVRFIYASKFISWKVNKVRDLFAYALLALQLVINGFNDHNYLIQLIIVSIYILLYRKELSKLIKKMQTKMR